MCEVFVLGNRLEVKFHILTGNPLDDGKDILLGIVETGFSDNGTFTMSEKDFNRHLGSSLVGIGKIHQCTGDSVGHLIRV